MSIGLSPSRRRSARRLIACGVLVATSQPTAAQVVCVAAKLQPPVVRLTTSIEACDYLALIAERTHPRDCGVKLRSVQGDATSRVHVLEQLLADSLARVFSENFGYLRWSSTGPAERWTLQVRLQQPTGSGTPPMVTLALFAHDSLRVTSDPSKLESSDRVTGALLDEQRGQTAGSLQRTNARWTAELNALITAHDGAVRKRWITTVLKHVPVMSGMLRPVREGQFAVAKLPIRDSDIRVEPTNRPRFRWQVTEMRTVQGGTGSARDSGFFGLAECQSVDGVYSCRLTDLLYGSASFPTAEATATFVRDKTPTFVPPASLYVVEYSPARRACTASGTMPQ